MGNLSSANRARSTEDEGVLKLRLYDYLPSEIIDNDTKPPKHIDYVKAPEVRLEPVHTFMHGALVKVDYVFDNKVIVSEEHTYTRENNLAQSRVIVIKWIDENGDPHPDSKARAKTYNEGKEQIAELRRIRENLIDWMRGAMQGTPLETAVQELLESLSDEVQDYLLSGSAKLSGAIGVDPAPWLDIDLESAPITYRHYLISELRYGLMI